jgi:signal transduction histidine kinase
MENTVLIVDDAPAVCQQFTNALVPMGFQCHSAQDGESALTLFERVQPAIVLLGIDLPDMDSTTLLRRLKGLNPQTEAFIIAEGQATMPVLDLLLAGAAAFVPRPQTEAMTAITVERLIEKAEIRNRVVQFRRNKALRDLVVNELIHEDVLVIGADYRIVDVNDALLRRLGVERHAVIGRFCHEITHHQDSPCSGEQHPCPLVETLRSGKPTQVTHIHLDHNNQPLTYSISCYPLLEDNRVVGAIELSRDISAEINKQKTLIEQEKLATIGRLAAGVAHEINNPLTTILTTAMLLQEDMAADDPVNQELDIIVSETLRCRKIVTSLLDFARQSPPDKKPVQLHELICETALLTRKAAAFKDVAIVSRCLETIPAIVADKGQLQQALINLLINAIEATDPSGVITVACRSLLDNSRVEITVEDNGAGIAPETIDKIFDPFFTTRDSGTGLGLSITSGIVAQHGGTITVDSAVGRGTTFTIRLPVDGSKRQ